MVKKPAKMTLYSVRKSEQEEPKNRREITSDSMIGQQFSDNNSTVIPDLIRHPDTNAQKSNRQLSHTIPPMKIKQHDPWRIPENLKTED